MLRRLGVVGTVIVLFGVLAGCSAQPRVGVLLPSTGEASDYGDSIESGIRLAVSNGRDRGQLPTGFEVLWADTGSEPRRAVSELQKMASERELHMIIGGATSAEAKALIPVLEELEVVCLSPSASAPGLAEQSKFFFRIYPSDELEGHTAAKFMFERLEKRRVVLYTGNPEYTQGIEPEFRKQYEDALKGQVVARIDIREEEWQQQSRRVLRTAPGAAVYIVGFAEEILGVLNHLADQGYDDRVVTTSAFYSTRVIRAAGELADGVLFPLPPFDRTTEIEPVLSFVNDYMDTYQRAPDVYAAHGFDAMRVAIQVMTKARPPEITEVRRALLFGFTDFKGVTGRIVFDESGDVKHYPKMFIVKKGQVLSYQRYIDDEKARILREVQNLLTRQG
jgi:branched-chain amino acid transport system substrate-binding protein